MNSRVLLHSENYMKNDGLLDFGLEHLLVLQKISSFMICLFITFFDSWFFPNELIKSNVL